MLFNNNLDGLIHDEIGLLTKLEYLCAYTSLYPSRHKRCPPPPPRKIELFRFQSNCGGGTPRGRVPSCDLSPNPAWTNGRLCPACPNVQGARCKAPVNCTGSSPAGIMCEAALTTQCDKYNWETPLGRSRCY